TRLAGTVRTGGAVSRTVTLKERLVRLPAASVAVTVTCVSPRGKVAPLLTEYVIAGLGVTASVAVAGGYCTTAPPGPVASTVRSAGTASAGAVVSRTVTLNDPVALLPAASVAVTVTFVTPSAN